MEVKTFKSIEEELQTYTEEELRIWNKGYHAAVEGVVDQLNSDQHRVLNKLLVFNGREDKKRISSLLESKLGVLDAYEEHYRKRLALLERDAE